MDKKQLTNEKFAAIWNDTDNFPNIRSIASHTGHTYEQIKSKAAKLRKKANDGKNVPELVDRSGVRGTQPLIPEMQHKFKGDMTEADCIAALRDVQNEHPDVTITRNFFRAATDIADSTWNRYFGTFLEFKRQSGLNLNRHQHMLERDIARHVSADHYREFNERQDYGSRYNRSKDNRVQVIVGASDLHDQDIDPFYLRVFIEACRVIQPDVINLGGDIFDLPEFSRFSVDPREWDVVGRIKFVHDNILAPLREACPDTQIDFLEGNHEYRLLRHLADATPALKAVLSDLLGLTVAKILGLDKYEVNYIAKGDLAAFNKADQKREVEKSYVMYDNTVLIHHHPHAKSWGMPGWNGHHHSWKVWHQKSAIFGPYQWMQLGCGHRARADYAEGEFWSLGFNICHYNKESKSVLHEYVNVTDMACVGGIYFHRNEEEMIGEFARRNS